MQEIIKKAIFTILALGVTQVYAQPANNTPCTSIALANSNCIDGSTIPAINYTTSGATTTNNPSQVPTCWNSGFSNTVWFTFTATSSAQKITTNVNLVGAGINNSNQLAVYSSSDNTCNGSFTLIGCQDDICDCSGSSDNQNAELTVSGLIPGQTYWVAVDGDGNSTGLFRIGTQAAPSNDVCSAAMPLSSGVTYPSSNIGSSRYNDFSLGDIQFTCGSNENMVFYSFTPPSSGTYYLNQWSQYCTSGAGTQVVIFDPIFNCSNLPIFPLGISDNAFELTCSSSSINSRYLSVYMMVGVTYLIAIDGFAGTECSYYLNIGPAVVLPVELLSFNAIEEDGKAFINWSTASEMNSAYYNIERGENVNDFKEIGSVEAAGNSTSIKKYQFEDKDFTSGQTFYYRLKQVDNDGRFTYSKIVALEIKNSAKGIAILNNPVSEYLSIIFSSAADDDRTLNVYSAIGTLVASFKVPAKEGYNEFHYNVSLLHKGMYIVELSGKSDHDFSRIIKN
jgi:hypothetical protein